MPTTPSSAPIASNSPANSPDLSRKTVNRVDFLGEVTFPTSLSFGGTQVGGLSGITYDPTNQVYYSVSDDRSQINPARFYTLKIDLSDGKLNPGDVTFQNVTTLLDASGNPFAPLSIDLEGITLTDDGTVYISSEGEANPIANRITNPFVNQFTLAGAQVSSLPIPAKFLPTSSFQDLNGDGIVTNADQPFAPLSGVRNNLAFESLTITPDRHYLYTATENALGQDGPPAVALNVTSPSRILRYDLTTGQPVAEFQYVTDPVLAETIPPGQSSNNGLVDLLALDNNGTLLSLERAFSTGVGNTIKLYEVKLENATDISSLNSVKGLDVDVVADKRLLLDFADLGIPLDNIEGLTLGPKLPDGRQSLTVVSDNNFSSTQFTQFLSFAIDTSTIPGTTTPTTLPNGVASGDTTQTSTVLWTRSTVLGNVTFEYSTDPNFGTIAGTATATVTDALQPVKVGITGLQARTDYYYRVTDAAGVKLGGEFSTAAAVGDRTGLRFGVSGDWRGELSPYPAISNADDRNLKFFVEHGDTIYADFESPVLPGVEQATTVDEYRLKHSEVYGDRSGLNTWADLRRSTSILATIDDHEVTNDFAGGAPASSDPRFNTTTGLINDTPLFENGLQAFQEYNPVRDEFYGETGDSRTAGERKLYRYNTYGSDGATYVLDNRSFRDQELPGVANPADPAQVGAFLARSFDLNPATGQPTTSRTILGQQQLSDLEADLLDADTQGITWKFVMVPEPIQNLGVVGASDRFEGYARERTDLLKFIDDNNIDNVVFISADTHSTLVNNLTYQVGPGQQQIATNAFEITTGSVGFDAPFGPTVADLATQLGLLSPATKAFYDALPATEDSDSLVNDKDDFIKQLVNAQLAPLGYDPLGLNDNLSIAAGKIDATLLQGDYLSTQTYAWSEFDVDQITQKLTVTTYGIDYYSQAELLSNPAAVLSRQPRIVSQFEVNPGFSTELTGNNLDNTITGGDRNDRINGLGGNDTISGGPGNDELIGGGGNDTFVIRRGDGFDTVTDFGGVGRGINPAADRIAETDVLQFQGEGLTARNLLLTQVDSNLVLSFEGVDQTQVVLKNVNLEDLDNLQKSTGAAIDLGNIRFSGQSQIRDSFDVVNADSQRTTVFNKNSVVFFNDLANTVSGLNDSNDVINGQGGDDTLLGLGGDDLLRGGAGNDTLTGGEGRDRFVLTSGSGTDTINDFTRGQDLLQLSGGLNLGQLSLVQGTGTNAGNALIRLTTSSEVLAILSGTQANTLTASDFVV